MIKFIRTGKRLVRRVLAPARARRVAAVSMARRTQLEKKADVARSLGKHHVALATDRRRWELTKRMGRAERLGRVARTRRRAAIRRSAIYGGLGGIGLVGSYAAGRRRGERRR